MKKHYLPMRHFIKLSLCLLMLAVTSNGWSQQSYTFTNASATGPNGPTQTQVTNAYTGTSLQGQVTATAGIQYWVVPNGVTNIRIETFGAQGGASGNNAGGLGARMSGEFNVSAGATLKIVVGQQGVNATNQAGGGGGTYVTLLNNTPLCIAGGGGGGYYTSYNALSATSAGTVSNTGNAGVYAQSNVYYGTGGTNGNGGAAGTVYSASQGGAGGGLLTNGANGSSSGAYGGTAFVNGAQGGAAMGNSSGVAGDGGFGGGGGGDWNTWTGAGAGGGYSGGGSATYYGCGGGGGSYNSGTNQSNTSGTNTAHGKVIITELCNITLSITGVNSSSAMCVGSTVTLTTNAVSNYSWNTGATTSSLVVSPNSTTVYSLTATSASNCVAGAVVTVVVNSATPVISASSSTNSTCYGKFVTLTGSGAVSHTWTGGAINGVPFIPTATQVYTLTGTNGCGAATATIGLTVVHLPFNLVTSNTLICQLQTVTLSVSGAPLYTWAPGNSTLSTIIVAPSASTIYTITVSDGNCKGLGTVAIVANPNPTITVAASSTNVCIGETVTLTASGANSYTWMNSTIIGTTGTVSPTVPILYQVSGINQFNCVTTTAQIVVVKPTPTLTPKTTNSLVCSGSSATLSVVGNADSYLWSTGSSTTTSVVNPMVSSTYTVTGTDNTSGCYTSKEITVNVFQTIIPASPSTTICQGSSITLTAGIGTNYQWSPVPSGFAFVTVKPTVPTIYMVSANTTSNGIVCVSTNTILIGLFPKPVVTAVASPTFMCRTKESVVLVASGTSNFVWTINNVTNTNAVVVFTTNLIQLHSLSVVGTDANGCKDTAVVLVRVDACTGLNEIEKISLGVYPNPNNGTFVIKTDVSIELELYNQLGQLIDRFMLDNTNNHQADVRNLSNGVYFVTGVHQGRKVTQKILINQ